MLGVPGHPVGQEGLSPGSVAGHGHVPRAPPDGRGQAAPERARGCPPGVLQQGTRVLPPELLPGGGAGHALRLLAVGSGALPGADSGAAAAARDLRPQRRPARVEGRVPAGTDPLRAGAPGRQQKPHGAHRLLQGGHRADVHPAWRPGEGHAGSHPAQGPASLQGLRPGPREDEAKHRGGAALQGGWGIRPGCLPVHPGPQLRGRGSAHEHDPHTEAPPAVRQGQGVSRGIQRGGGGLRAGARPGQRGAPLPGQPQPAPEGFLVGPRDAARVRRGARRGVLPQAGERQRRRGVPPTGKERRGSLQPGGAQRRDGDLRDGPGRQGHAGAAHADRQVLREAQPACERRQALRPLRGVRHGAQALSQGRRKGD
mmetsp:Transcript_3972/g.10752  ORF Transcript_3972/g.10752 Transcript_3972/m.10752 type:complete len:370 (+) Transcript_3972:2174-3283(+)